MTIADKLQLTLDNKNAVKLALQNKGANPTDVFSTYAGLIDGLATSGIATPQIISPINGATGVAQSPIVTGSRFSGLDPDGFADVHVASTWDFASDSAFTNILHTSGRDTVNLESYDCAAADVKFEGITVYVRVEYEGGSGEIAVSAAVMFETALIEPGVVIGGDIVVGQKNGYWLLAAPSSNRVLRIWGNQGDDTSLPNSPNPDPNDGVYNTDVLVGSSSRAAAMYCRTLGAEYFLGNIEEMYLIAINQEAIDSNDPSLDGTTTQPTLANIGAGTARDGSNSRSATRVWASTEFNADFATCVIFPDNDATNTTKHFENWVIPFRRIPA